jgi:hypothetical protein
LRNIRLDAETGEFVREERVRVGTGTNAKEILADINHELSMIVRQVKTLKARADELKAMKAILERKAEPIGSAPPAEVQSPSAASPDPT